MRGEDGAPESARDANERYSSTVYDFAIGDKRAGARYIGKWNWGAFGLSWLWLLNHRRVALGILAFFLSFMPIVNLAFAVYLGMSGNAIAVDSGRFGSDEQFVAVQNAWRDWAFGFIALVLAAAVARILVPPYLTAG